VLFSLSHNELPRGQNRLQVALPHSTDYNMPHFAEHLYGRHHARAKALIQAWRTEYGVALTAFVLTSTRRTLPINHGKHTRPSQYAKSWTLVPKDALYNLPWTSHSNIQPLGQPIRAPRRSSISDKSPLQRPPWLIGAAISISALAAALRSGLMALMPTRGPNSPSPLPPGTGNRFSSWLPSWCSPQTHKTERMRNCFCFQPLLRHLHAALAPSGAWWPVGNCSRPSMSAAAPGGCAGMSKTIWSNARRSVASAAGRIRSANR
jgi:hypothetical protein